MATEIVPAEMQNESLAAILQEHGISTHDPKVFSQVASTGDWLPYLMLGGSNTELVKEGKLPLQHYAVVKGENFVDLGKTLYLWVFAWRPKAMDMNVNPPLSFFKPDTEIFQKIKSDSFGDNSRKMFGPEYLAYIPDYGFAGLFMGSKTARNEAKNVHTGLAIPEGAKSSSGETLKPRGPVPLMLTSKFIKPDGSKFSWHGIVATVSDQTLATPDPEEFKEQLSKFLKPVDSEVKVAAPAAATDRG